MPNPSNESKQRWNASHYTQIKVSINPETAAAFKAACMTAGVSMASVLSEFMADYSKTTVEEKPPAEPFATRKKRRRFVKIIMSQMEQLSDAEERYRDNMPENLQGSLRFEAAEQSIAVIREILELMEQIY